MDALSVKVQRAIEELYYSKPKETDWTTPGATKTL
jgi:hypothetical protein